MHGNTVHDRMHTAYTAYRELSDYLFTIGPLLFVSVCSVLWPVSGVETDGTLTP